MLPSIDVAVGLCRLLLRLSFLFNMARASVATLWTTIQGICATCAYFSLGPDEDDWQTGFARSTGSNHKDDP